MKQYLKTFFEDFEYPSECSELLLKCYDSITREQEKNEILQAVLTAYANDRDVSYFVLEEYVQKICDGFAYHEYTVWLLLYVLMSKRLMELYREYGISMDIWRESMADLKCKAEECKMLKGIDGTFVASWFPKFFRLKRFTLGRLQFDLTKFEEERFVCKNGRVLTAGECALAVHIPRSQIPLSKEACDDAYQRAVRFFAGQFQGDWILFTCDSWMLYPKNSELLHEKSNVRRFGEEYELVSVTDYPEGEHPDAWRIFNVEFNGDISVLPEDSHLQRSYRQHMLAGGVTGRAYGVKLMPRNAD